MKKQASNRAALKGEGDDMELRLYGAVGDDWDGFTDDAVADLLSNWPTGQGVVRINSPGGYVYQGMAIYTLLKKADPRVVMIDGLAASMGSVIACAGQRTEIAVGAMMMIHNPWNVAMGDAEDLRKNAEVLDKMKESIISIYESKTGQDRETLSTMMDEETWLTAEEAVEWGFADAISGGESEEPQDLAVLANSKNMPDPLKQRMQQQMKAKDSATSRKPQAVEPINSKQEESNMTTTTDNASAATENAEHEASLAKARNEAVQAERKRVEDIRAYVANAANVKPSFGEGLISDGVTFDEAKASIDRMADYLKDNAPEIDTTIAITRDERDTVRAGVAKALLNRDRPNAYKIDGDDPARDFANMSLMGLARNFVESSGKNTKRMSRVEIAQAAFHTTSDFPLILENVVSKSLRDSYELAPRTFPMLGVRETLPDFKNVSRTKLGSAPKLQKVQEGGEYTYGDLDEDGETYRVFKYGKVLALSWEALINDDLGAFTRIPGKMGQAAAQLESDIFWAELTGNPNMADGTALFHSSRGNLADTPAAISVASLSAARAAMSKQKDGDHYLAIDPQFLVVPPDILTVAEQFVGTNFTADSSGNINPFAGRLQVISEPRLSANSATAWYAFASPSAIDTISYAYLQGEEGPRVTTEDGFSVDGMKVKIRHVFGAKAIEPKGMFKNAGS